LNFAKYWATNGSTQVPDKLKWSLSLNFMNLILQNCDFDKLMGRIWSLAKVVITKFDKNRFIGMLKASEGCK